jgi:hypothetical protein
VLSVAGRIEIAEVYLKAVYQFVVLLHPKLTVPFTCTMCVPTIKEGMHLRSVQGRNGKKTSFDVLA